MFGPVCKCTQCGCKGVISFPHFWPTHWGGRERWRKFQRVYLNFQSSGLCTHACTQMWNETEPAGATGKATAQRPLCRVPHAGGSHHDCDDLARKCAAQVMRIWPHLFARPGLTGLCVGVPIPWPWAIGGGGWLVNRSGMDTRSECKSSGGRGVCASRRMHAGPHRIASR